MNAGAKDGPAGAAGGLAAERRWHCLRTRNRQELQAARALRQQAGLEVYGPRIRYRKPTRRGTVWFVESLFPSYLFARFDLAADGKAVRYATGVTGIVAFGGRPAVVPDDAIARLREELGDEETHVCAEPFRAGDTAELVRGPFRGLEAVILRVLPARQRVRVLLNFLGRETETEIGLDQLAKPAGHPLAGVRPQAGPPHRPSRIP